MGAIASKAAENRQLSQSQGKDIKRMIGKYTDQIAKALPNVGITAERFARLAISAISASPKLAECDQRSFLAAMMTSAQLGMEPNTPLGQAYLIPYKGQVQFQLGYKGMIDLVYRSGKVTDIYAETVYENDDFQYEMGLNSKLVHVPSLKGPRGNAIAYYAVYHTKDGGHGFVVMSKDDVNSHAKKFSKSYGVGPWQTNYDEMAKKTVLKRLLKYAPVSTEVTSGVSADGSTRTLPVEFKPGDDVMDVSPDYVETEYTVSDADDSEFNGRPADDPVFDFPPIEDVNQDAKP